MLAILAGMLVTLASYAGYAAWLCCVNLLFRLSVCAANVYWLYNLAVQPGWIFWLCWLVLLGMGAMLPGYALWICRLAVVAEYAGCLSRPSYVPMLASYAVHNI
jgi:hypothetical protein